jgi:hypothetical protein
LRRALCVLVLCCTGGRELCRGVRLGFGVLPW